MKSLKGKLTSCERFDTSRNGNPRYLCVLLTEDNNTATFYTGVDSMHGYAITNYLDKTISVSLKMNRGKLTLQSID